MHNSSCAVLPGHSLAINVIGPSAGASELRCALKASRKARPWLADCDGSACSAQSVDACVARRGGCLKVAMLAAGVTSDQQILLLYTLRKPTRHFATSGSRRYRAAPQQAIAVLAVASVELPRGNGNPRQPEPSLEAHCTTRIPQRSPVSSRLPGAAETLGTWPVSSTYRHRSEVGNKQASALMTSSITDLVPTTFIPAEAHAGHGKASTETRLVKVKPSVELQLVKSRGTVQRESRAFRGDSILQTYGHS